jgi:transcriptional regulator with XRE-family HTH domain
MSIRNLGEFVLKEMQQRSMSAREFARFTGLNHQTVNDFLNSMTDNKEREFPSLKTLLRLAQATNTDICALIWLMLPNPESIDKVSAEDIILSQRISQLPPEMKKLVEAMISGAALNASSSAE